MTPIMLDADALEDGVDLAYPGSIFDKGKGDGGGGGDDDIKCNSAATFLKTENI